MSKKCCGIIYKDEKFCTMCGKELVDVADIPEEKLEGKKDNIEDNIIEEKTEEINENISEEKNTELETDNIPENKDVVKTEENSEEKKDSLSETTKDKEEDSPEEKQENEEDEEDDGTASGGLKFFGTLMLLAMFASIAIVVLGVYFIFLNPFYRNHDINNPVVYEQMATDTDVTNIQTRPALAETSIDSVLNEQSTSQVVATQSDATDTDASEDASDDME